MSIFELLSFDIVEFATSIEGILIIVGILFLIIGIALLLMGRGKKTDAAVITETKDTTVTADSSVADATQSTTVEPVVQSATPVVNDAVVSDSSAESLQSPIVVPASEGGLQDNVTTPAVEPIDFTKGSSDVLETPNNIDETKTLPNASLNDGEVSLTDPVTSDIPEMKSEEKPVTVYGGANPENINKEILEEKPREIYGGANPLDNTGRIPTETVNEAYAGSVSSNATPEETVSNIESITSNEPSPVVDVTPAVAPVEVSTTPVEATPVVTPTEVPTTPVEAAPAVTPVEVSTTPVEAAPAVTPVVETMPTTQEEPKKEEIEKLEF